jgi:hypothetical protein
MKAFKLFLISVIALLALVSVSATATAWHNDYNYNGYGDYSNRYNYEAYQPHYNTQYRGYGYSAPTRYVLNYWSYPTVSYGSRGNVGGYSADRVVNYGRGYANRGGYGSLGRTYAVGGSYGYNYDSYWPNYGQTRYTYY